MKRIYKTLLLTAITMLLMSMPMQVLAANKLNKKTATISVGNSVQLKLSDAKSGVRWKSSKPSVAVVSKSGKVTGKSLGTVKISAAYKGRTYVCSVTVKSKFQKGKWLMGPQGGFALHIHKVQGNKFVFSSRVLNVSCSKVTAKINKNGKTATAQFRCNKNHVHRLYFTKLSNGVRVKETSKCYDKLLAPMGSSKSTITSDFHTVSYWEKAMMY